MIKMKNKFKLRDKRNWPFFLVFAIGFLLMMYPTISDYYYRVESNQEIEDFQEKAAALDENEILRRMDLAEGYNTSIDPSKLGDPYTEKEKAGRAEYARMLEIEEKIGFVEVPKIKQKIPIYAGTSMDILDKGAGHLEGTSLPIGGPSTHTVITAHRGLSKAKFFRHLDKLEKGDIFYIHNIETVLAYEVDQILVVEPSDFDPVLVVPGQDYATLLTCTPYMINSKRLLVRGHRIDYVPPTETKPPVKYQDILAFIIPLALVLFAVMLYVRQDYKRKKQHYDQLRSAGGEAENDEQEI